MSEIINEENIDEYREKLNVNFNNSIKELALNIIEAKYSYLLENNKFDDEMLDSISYEIRADDYFNDCLDNLLIEKIEDCIVENDLGEEEAL